MPGMRAGPNVLDLEDAVRPNGSTLANLIVEQVAANVAALIDKCGNSTGSSAFEAMTEAMAQGEKTEGTVALTKAAAPRAMALWGLEALRGQLFSKGENISLPASAPVTMPAPGPTPATPAHPAPAPAKM